MNEEMPGQIGEEVKKLREGFFDTHPEQMTADHLNNLRHNLLGGIKRTIKPEFLKVLSRPERHSELRRSQTIQEYWAAIDQAMDALGLRSAFEDLNSQIHIFAEDEDYENKNIVVNKLNELLLPVYRELLKKGYNTYDIVS